jgi:mono/diheme cytochrome c family protein
MSLVLKILSATLILSCGAWFAQQSSSQEKSQEKPAEKVADKASVSGEKPAPATAPTSATAVKKENPVKSSPDVLAAAKKVFGYDCAMCHGEAGDGKGELVESMSLKMKDWHDPAVLSGMSDADIYDLIVKGKDKMIGEGDRLAPAKVWGLVHYVRTFAKKSSAT